MLMSMEEIVLWSFTLEKLEDMDTVFVVIDGEEMPTVGKLYLIDTFDVELVVGCHGVGPLRVHRTITNHYSVELDTVRM